ncbi:MAG TPA: hypothetical protein PLR30_14910, partial [Saprospiraceae bacterium]|nr:hypothetical protein [Saprospiraceae bacterium]
PEKVVIEEMAWEHKTRSMEFALPGLTVVIYKWVKGKEQGARSKEKASTPLSASSAEGKELKAKAVHKAKAKTKKNPLTSSPSKHLTIKVERKQEAKAEVSKTKLTKPAKLSKQKDERKQEAEVSKTKLTKPAKLSKQKEVPKQEAKEKTVRKVLLKKSAPKAAAKKVKKK